MCSSIKVLLAFCAFLALSSRAVQAARNNSKYNVVVVVFDDLRPTIGAYGDILAQTPHLDAFINGSHYFTRAYSQVNKHHLNELRCV